MPRHLCLIVFAAALPLLCSTPTRAAEKAQTRYLRAVYVLRTLDPSLSAGPLSIPRRIVTDDATNALVQHPDKIFVLTTLARDLEALSRKKGFGDADYYAAHAYAKLGRRADAARIMDRYLLTAPYRAEDYLSLLRWLYEEGDYAALRSAAAAWRARDPRCNEDRLTYVWAGYRAQEQTGEALAALADDACGGWKPQVLAARTALDAGDRDGAERTVRNLLRRFPRNDKDILAFWEYLREAEHYP